MYSIKTDLGVSGNGTIDKDLTVQGSAVIKNNLTVNGTVDFANATFTTINVTGLAQVGSVEVSGNANLKGNVIAGTDSTNTVTINSSVVANADITAKANLSVEGNTILGNESTDSVTVNGLSIFNQNVDMKKDVVIGTTGTDSLTVKSNATFEGDVTIEGTTRHNGDIIMGTGTTATFDDVTINGDLDGTFSIVNGKFTTITVTGTSNQANINASGNITASGASSRISSSRLEILGANGILTSTYNDPARPSDIKSSFEPYQISSQSFVGNNVSSRKVITGDETDLPTAAGLVAKGSADVDYLHVKGNNTTGTSRDFLVVDGAANFKTKVTVKDLEVTGTVTGLTVDLTGQDIEPNSVTATTFVQAYGLKSTGSTTVDGMLQVGGMSTFQDMVSITGDVQIDGQTTTVKDLVVTGTTTGITAEANVDGLDIKPNSVVATTTVQADSIESATTVTATGNFIGAGAQLTGPSTALAVSNNATIGGILTVVGNTKLKTFESSSDGIVGGTLNVTGKTTVQDLDVQGILSGTFTVDLTGKDITPKSVTTTENITVGGAFESKGASKVTTLTASQSVYANALSSTTSVTAASANIVGVMKATSIESATVQAQPAGAGTVTVASNMVAGKDLTVSGTFKPEGGLDLSTVDVSAKSVTTTAGATIGGDLTVNGTVDLSNALVTAQTFTATATDKLNSFPKLSSTDATIINGNITTLNVASDATFEGNASLVNATLSGTLSVDGVSSVGTINADEYTTTGAKINLTKSTEITGNLNVSGTLTAGVIDLSTTDVSVKSLNSLGNAHVAGDLTVDGTFDLSAVNLSAQSLASSSTLNVVGASTLAGLTATTTKVTSLESSGSAQLKGGAVITGTLSASDTATLSGGVSTTTVSASAGVSTGTLTAIGVVTLNGATSAKAVKVDSIAANTGTLQILGASTTTGNMHVGGTFSADSFDLAGASLLNVAAISSTGNLDVGGDLTIAGTFDQSAVDVTVKSLTSSGLVKSDTLSVTAASTLASVTANSLTVTTTSSLTGKVTAGAAMDVTGALVAKDALTVSGTTTLNGDLASANANISIISPVQLSKALAVTDVSTLGTVVASQDPEQVLHVNGDATFYDNVNVKGTITAEFDMTGRDISPRDLKASRNITAGGSITSSTSITAKTGIFGDAEGDPETNVLQLNGSILVSGKIRGEVDQSGSVITVKGVTAAEDVSVGRNLIMVNAGAGAGGNVTGNIITSGNIEAKGTLKATGATTVAVLNATNTTITGTLGVTGVSTLAATNVNSLTVTTTAGITGNATVGGTLGVTGKTTVKDLAVTGVLTADVANLVTTSVGTKQYYVINKAAESVSTATYTPDGTSNVYNATITANTVIQPITGMAAGKAGSWFIYVTQDATGGHTVGWTADYKIHGGEINQVAGSVTICNVVYCGIGSTYDVFISQRPA